MIKICRSELKINNNNKKKINLYEYDKLIKMENNSKILTDWRN